MGCACPAWVPPDPFVEARNRVQQHANAWFDQVLEQIDPQQPPTLLALSELFTRTRGGLLGGCLQALIEALYTEFRDQRQAECPHCAAPLKRKRFDRKRINTLQGPLVLERPYFYCAGCKHGFHPFDQALELARAFHQYDVQAQVVELAAEMPYSRAAEIVGKLTGVTVSDHHGHATLERVAECADLDTVIPDAEEIRSRIEQLQTRPEDKPVLVAALDGAHAPTRPRAGRSDKRGPGRWREVKGLRLYLSGEDGRIVQLASWHQIQDAETMRRDLKRIAGRIPCDAVETALVGDGAAWVWTSLGECFPGARQVLDYYHCAEHLHRLAQAQYPDPTQAVQWVEATLVRLSQGRVSDVIGGLRRMLPRSVEALEQRDALAGYLDRQRNRIDYDECRQQGLPIGSGGIESANKFISHARLKRSGAWWVVDHGNAMLRLRCALYNGTFERVFAKYRAMQRREGGTNG